MIAFISDIGVKMGLAKSEEELANKIKSFLKAKVAESELTYEELAKEMKKHGLKETKASVTNKLARGTFPATFLLGALAALEQDGIKLEDV
jgi:hypothetical protein